MKILSLDDHPLFSSGLKESLLNCNLGFEIITTLHPKEALDYLQKNNNIDLLILDLSMPEMDGIMFIKALISRRIITPVVLMSANEDIVILDEAFKLGVLGFLPKSWSVEQLAEALIKIQKGEIVIPKHIASSLARMSKNAIENTQSSLSERQIEILKMVRSGLTNQGIGVVLYISEATVKSHLQTIFKILGAKNRIDSVCKAESLNILSPKI